MGALQILRNFAAIRAKDMRECRAIGVNHINRGIAPIPPRANLSYVFLFLCKAYDLILGVANFRSRLLGSGYCQQGGDENHCFHCCCFLVLRGH